jgi:hypothetical protein
MARPFRFGGGLFSAASAAEWAMGATTESSDMTRCGRGSLLADVPRARCTLLAAAMATTRLRVSCTVFDNDFPHQPKEITGYAD